MRKPPLDRDNLNSILVKPGQPLVGNPSRPSKNRNEICRNFLNNRCTWGNRCHRIHLSRKNEANTYPGPVSSVEVSPSSPFQPATV
jgi:hypothetical protein